MLAVEAVGENIWRLWLLGGLGERKAYLPPFSFSKNLIFRAIFLNKLSDTRSWGNPFPSLPWGWQFYFPILLLQLTTPVSFLILLHNAESSPLIHTDGYCTSKYGHSYLNFFFKLHIVPLKSLIQGRNFPLEVQNYHIFVLISMLLIAFVLFFGKAILIIGLAFLSIDNLLHTIDLFGNKFVLELQKLLILRLIVFQDVGYRLSVFIEHSKCLIDIDGEWTIRCVDDIWEMCKIAKHINKDLQGWKDWLFIAAYWFTNRLLWL